MSTNIRFKGITDTTANIAADKFQGRIAWNTTLNRFVVFYDATNYGTMARRDVFETFAAGIRNNGDYQDSLGTVRISSTGLVTGSGVAAADLTTGQAVVTTTGGRLVSQAYATFLGTIGAVGGRGNGAAGRVMRWSDANTATSDAGLTTTQTGGVTTALTIGDGLAGASVINFSARAGSDCNFSFQSGGVNRIITRFLTGSDTYDIAFRDDAGAGIDSPIAIVRAAGSAIVLGGAGASKRPVKLTGALQDSTGTQRMSNVGAITAASLAAANLTLGRVARIGASGAVVDDAGLTTAQIGGVTNVLVLGETSAGANTTLSVSSPSSYSGSLSWRWGTVTRWAVSNIASTGSWQLRAFDAAGGEIDQPVTIANAASGLMTLGGATARPLKLTGVLQDSAGTQRMSNVGAATMASLQATNLAGTGTRNVVADASGNLSASANVTREFIIQPLPITNAAPGTVNVVDANMKSFGFDGNASTEELFYHVDLQHDYVAGTDIIVHVHWMPSTANAGNVRFQWYYQWVEEGGTFTAATLGAPTAVAAGGVAWADKRTDFTISGAGKTYNSRLLLRLFRDPTDGTDTYGDDAVLSSVGVHYTANPIQAG